jgi:hypothetical protein
MVRSAHRQWSGCCAGDGLAGATGDGPAGAPATVRLAHRRGTASTSAGPVAAEIDAIGHNKAQAGPRRRKQRRSSVNIL